jgi:hypothetical protein
LKKNRRSDLKNVDLKRKTTKFETKIKQNQIIRDEIKNQFQSRKRITTTTNNNQKNEDHI